MFETINNLLNNQHVFYFLNSIFMLIGSIAIVILSHNMYRQDNEAYLKNKNTQLPDVLVTKSTTQPSI